MLLDSRQNSDQRTQIARTGTLVAHIGHRLHALERLKDSLPDQHGKEYAQYEHHLGCETQP